MAKNGWPSFHQQEDAFSTALAAYQQNDPHASDLEGTLAVADAECTLASRYGVALLAAEKRVAAETQQTQATTIIAYLDQRMRAVDAAREVLGS